MKELEGLKVIIKNLNYNKVIDDIEFETMDRMIDDAECEFKILHLQNVSISLRDKFAMNAINGYTSAHNSDGDWATVGCEEDIAEMSYKIADAMLKQREQ